MSDQTLSDVVVAAGALLRVIDGTGSPDAREEQTFGDALEIWIAELLSADSRWTLRGRWFDGLAFERCVPVDNKTLDTAGYIWRIDTQTRIPFRATVSVAGERLVDFTVEVGAELSADQATCDSQWLFVFARNARYSVLFRGEVIGLCAFEGRDRSMGIAHGALETTSAYDRLRDQCAKDPSSLALADASGAGVEINWIALNDITTELGEPYVEVNAQGGPFSHRE